MSNQYDNSNRGAVWHNTRKRDGKRDPDLTGTLNVNGEEFFVSIWENEKKGQNQPVLTMSVRKDDRSENPSKQSQQSSYQPQNTSPVDVSDEIPW